MWRMGNESIGIMTLNGWAASPQAWNLCGFMKSSAYSGFQPKLYSYVDQLDGKPEEDFSKGGRFILVGWSMGGSSALRLACRWPKQIAGLILVAATPRMMEDCGTSWKGMSPRRLEALRKGLELTHGQGFFGVPDGRPNPYMTDTSENLERGLSYLLNTDIRREVERVFGGGCAFPVHILQSRQDGIVRSSNAQWLKSVFPNAVLTMVEGGEHALPVFMPEKIDMAVASAVSRIETES